MTTKYTLVIDKDKAKLKILITANDGGHAQAQAADISRALKADKFYLGYELCPPTYLSELFRRLAYNDFSHKQCDLWVGSFCNQNPIIYTLKQRYYVRPMLLDYLQIHKEGCVKPSCGNKMCVNPYHNSYKTMKASKLGDADRNIALVFAGQGVPVKEIAKALNVNRSTIYRTLKRERIPSGTQGH